MSGLSPRQFWMRIVTLGGVARAAYRGFDRNDGGAMAGYIAYSVLLSVFPFAIFSSALSGMLIGPEERARVVDALFGLAPEHIAQTLEPVLLEVIGHSRGGALTFSAIVTLWVASNAVESIRVAFDRAYRVERERGFIRRRLVAFGFVLMAAVTFTILGFLIILAPLIITLASDFLGLTAPDWIGFLRYGLGLGVFILFLLALNRWLPSRAPAWRKVVPGIFVTAVLWIIGATGFSIYLNYAPSYTITYGAFAGVIVTLLFFYITGAVVIYGAEVNAALLAARHEEAT